MEEAGRPGPHRTIALQRQQELWATTEGSEEELFRMQKLQELMGERDAAGWGPTARGLAG